MLGVSCTRDFSLLHDVFQLFQLRFTQGYFFCVFDDFLLGGRTRNGDYGRKSAPATVRSHPSKWDQYLSCLRLEVEDFIWRLCLHIRTLKDDFEKLTHHARAIWAGVQPFAFAIF